MNNLPNDILMLIFNYLNIMERVKLRLVSIRFRDLINQIFQIHDLVVSDYSLDNRWWHTYDLINYKDNIVRFLDLSYPTHLLNNLKRLKFNENLKFSDLKRIERFNLLIHLEIAGTLEFSDLDENVEVTIDLPDLRILYIKSIKQCNQKNVRIVFQSSLLESVYFGDYAINYISTIDNSNVKYLEFHLDHFNNQDSLLYTSAEIIKCNQALDMNIEILNYLVTSGNLKEIHLNIEEFTNLSLGPKTKLAQSRLVQICDALLNQNEFRQTIMNSMIDIYVQGVRISKQNQYQTVLFFGKLIRLHYNYYRFIPMRLYSVISINYQELIDTVRVFPPMMMIKRYPNIQQVNMTENRCINDRSFILFLEYFENLSFLNLQFTEFPQDFFDKLPKLSSLCNSLNHLIILGKEQLNFDFIFKFEFLHNFMSNLCTVDMVLQMIAKFNSHGTYEFYYDQSNELHFKKMNNNQYNLTIKENIRNFELEELSTSNSNHGQLIPNGVLDYIYPNLTFCELVQKIEQNRHILRHSFDHRT